MPVDLAAELAALPAAVVVVVGTVVGWWLFGTGRIVWGREHQHTIDTLTDQLEEERADKRMWRDTAMRALNVGEAAVRRDRD